MIGAAFPNTISHTAAVVAPGLMVLGIIMFVGKFSGAHPEPGGEHRVRLRPRASRTGPAPRPRRAGRRTGLHLRPIRLPRSGDPRVPLVPKGSVFNDEYRHTSLIATLRKTWNLGEAFTQRDASARTFDDLFTLQTPHDPETWVNVTALPVPAWHPRRRSPRQRAQRPRREHGTRHHRNTPGELGLELPSQLDDPASEPTPEDIIEVFRQVAGHYFPLLAPDSTVAGHPAST